LAGPVVPETPELETTTWVKDGHTLFFEEVDLSIARPLRRPDEQIPGNRRPVVAIVDTGVAAHEWFTGQPPEHPIVRDARVDGWQPDHVFDEARSEHGTFIAGVIHQHAPDADLLSLALRRDDSGHLRHGQIYAGLQWLHQRMAAGSGKLFVDVICVAIGFRQIDEGRAAQLEEVIRALGAQGSWVITPAGNHAPGWHNGEDDRVYPAALLARPSANDLPMEAVGATNPDGTRAAFSITGEWVTRQFVGVDVVSIAPEVAQLPEPVSRGTAVISQRVTGYSKGDGTSIAAATCAGLVAQALLNSSGNGIDDVRPDVAAARVRQALATVGGLVP